MKLNITAMARRLSAHAARTTFILCFFLGNAQLPKAQATRVELTAAGAYHLHNREAHPATDGSIELNAKPGSGMMILKDIRFKDGTIKLKVRGENKPGASFVGIAFNIQDENHYEAVYFRPFNFKNKERERHALQYVSMPDYPWDSLRTGFPGKYENKIDPAPDPDSWLDATIVVKGKSIKVYLNEAAKPLLEVESLSSSREERAIALWVGGNSKGSFKDLNIIKATTNPAAAVQ